MPGEEAGPKLVRLLAFVGAGIICTTAINLWRDLERKAAAQRATADMLEHNRVGKDMVKKSN
ncbi:hypothetical protein ACHQM5_018414 [Ranunculus cassubicifolius]